jgi:AcrR family transcriptional regulator
MTYAAIPLAGAELTDRRHVCGLFEGPDHAYRTLLPFITDGLSRGERAFHIIDPEKRVRHLERLAEAGIDTEVALRAGQLEVTTWDVAYLAGGRFDRARMVSLVEAALSDGRRRGYPLTRVIGYMEWADPSVADVHDLARYEIDIDAALRGLPDPVICAYDLSRHDPGLAVQMLTLHPLGVVGGALRSTGGAQPRDRILQAASELFTSKGIGATGVDALIKAAGVAKATFYRQFPSKDDLVVAWLRDGRTRWLDRARAKAEASAASANELIPAFFDAVADWLKIDDFRGCPYLNAALELSDPDHPAERPIQDYFAEVQAYLRQSLASGGYPAPDEMAAELHALLAGAISLSAATRNLAPALAARAAAIRLLGEETASKR